MQWILCHIFRYHAWMHIPIYESRPDHPVPAMALDGCLYCGILRVCPNDDSCIVLYHMGALQFMQRRDQIRKRI